MNQLSVQSEKSRSAFLFGSLCSFQHTNKLRMCVSNHKGCMPLIYSVKMGMELKIIERLDGSESVPIYTE